MSRTPYHESAAFKARVKFNSGFHDATQDASLFRPQRTAKAYSRTTWVFGRSYPLPSGKEWAAYRAGYAAGWASFKALGVREETSEPAWLEYQRSGVKVA